MSSGEIAILCVLGFVLVVIIWACIPNKKWDEEAEYREHKRNIETYGMESRCHCHCHCHSSSASLP